jgi:hypothetical protein
MEIKNSQVGVLRLMEIENSQTIRPPCTMDFFKCTACFFMMGTKLKPEKKWPDEIDGD